ncbi:AbrB/MazE/SpoVT family DNA-binding domain-containing protein [Halarchaeum sp. P4]|uniref:AbrB/MazE/SpoVT family DNA-binding domain-containing protein n=1 Tax=Halarchaeum sp. P4 TaxID=3421639 RepID=UPI003EC1189C
MSADTGTDESEETYGEAELNDRGRLTIPKDLRDTLNLEGGTTFTVIREGGDIRLVRQLPDLHTLTSGRDREDWTDDAFRDAGETTFGGR